MSQPILSFAGIGKKFGAVPVLDDVTFQVRPGARHALIGPNGAGKSTLFAITSGRLAASTGTITFADRDVTAQNEVARAGLGIQQTFQHSSLFTSFTALDNVAVAVQRIHGIATSWWRPAHAYRTVRDESMGILERVGLADRHDVLVEQLSHGERRQLEVAVALSTDPRLLLLDEPTAGMSVAETNRFIELVRRLPEDMTVLFVEHDIDVVMALASAITVLNLGSHVRTGSPEDVAADDAVQEAYLSGSSKEDLFADAGGELA